MAVKKIKPDSNSASGKVSEPEVVYKTKNAVAGTGNKTDLGVTRAAEQQVMYNYQPFYTDNISLLNKSKKGLNASSAIDFLSLSGFTQDEFQETFKTTVKTIQNHVNRDLTLDAALSEKLLKSFALFDKGASIFGSAKSFHQWLGTPAYGLGNQLPFDLMDTITGIQLIEEELIRIEFGDLA